MLTSLNVRKLVAALVVALVAGGPGAAYAADAAAASKSSPLTMQAVELFGQGKLQEAALLGHLAAVRDPGDWLSHAVLSYLAWQQGNVVVAIESGEKAVKLAPRKLVGLTNLARMEEALDHFDSAASLYEKAMALDAGDSLPRLGLARCYIKLGRVDDGLSILAAMATDSKGNFDWYYQAADTYLRIDKPELAVDCASRAKDLASTPAQESACATQLMAALLRSGQVDRARGMMDYVFQKCHPQGYELFVRAADSLLPAPEPASAELLLTAALESLRSQEDAEGFYRLGRIFQDRASAVTQDASRFAAWMGYAESAYRRAAELDALQARYHLAYAGALDWKGERVEMARELSKAQSLNSLDPLPAFLLARAGATTGDLATTDSSASGTTANQVNLSKVQFSVNGVNCRCHLAKIEEALSKIAGVAFVNIGSQEPYRGAMLVDESLTPIDRVVSQCADAFPAGTAGQALFTLAVTSSQPVQGTAEAVRIAQNERYGNVLQFYSQLSPVEPALPVSVEAGKIASVR